MVSIRLKTHIGPDGVLTLEVPDEFREKDVDALLVLEPISSEAIAGTPEERGWPAGFFEQTAGSIQDETFRRWPQGEYETREEL